MDETQVAQEIEENAPEKKRLKKSGKHLSLDQQLENVKNKKKVLDEQMRALKAQISTRDRKKRAHRLIELGAVVESVTGAPVEKSSLVYLEEFLRGHRDELGAALARGASA